LEKESFDFILTAHHLDDNIETSLMNFFRGTGIAGLRGILPKHGGLVRPLLPFSKEELLGYARQNGLIWVEDSSNESDKYARNYLRHHLIPLVETIYPAVSGNLAANIRRFKDTELLYIQAVELHKKKLCEKRNGEVHIPVLKLQHTIPLKSVLFEIVRDFTFGPQQLDDIMNLLSGDTGKYVQSPTHRILRNRKWLIITPNDAEGSGHLLIEETGSWAIQGGGIHLRLMAGNSVDLRAGRQLAQLDAGKIKFPLLFRRWKKGDYFYPLGMKKKKKLARFLIDHKMSLPDKEKVWVLEMNKKIIWVAGLRIDDRFRITDQTMEILHIEMRMT
jgi:tRNA(Ile)-lysidine synthase